LIVKAVNNERKVIWILGTFVGWLNRKHNSTSNNCINKKLWASTESCKYNSCNKSWVACCDCWNSFFSSSFGREKMGSNFNSSFSINGNFWYGSLFTCKAHNSSRHLWSWWVYPLNNIIKYASSSLLV